MKVLISLMALALVVGWFAWTSSVSFSGNPCGIGTRLIGDPPTECQLIVQLKEGR